MDIVRTWRVSRSWAWLVIGAACFTFVGWRFNVPAAAWIAPVLLIRFFRDQKRWYTALPAIALLALASFIQMNGGWDLDPWMACMFSILRPAAFVVALYADWALFRRLPPAAATFVYPAVYLAVDYAIALTPLGTGMSASATQFGMPAISQIASITGIWGIGFIAGWVAAVINLLWERGFTAASVRRLAAVAAAVMATTIAFGSARFALTRPSSPTVRVGSVTIAHPRDYWAWIDKGTPRELVAGYSTELADIQEQLFAQSERAAAAGAKVIFWSEGNAVLTEDNEQAFMERAARFASCHGVYFAPAMVVLRYGQPISDNKIVMFAPDGARAFTYVKTMSWYPTGSDGVLKVVNTPYGKIGSAICFDMDFPSFIHRLGALRADIVLVPAFDTERIRPYHTEVGLMRGLENGFSVIRQTNKGTSMAIDGSGRILARQEFFETSDHLMLADVPTQRVPTLYRALGEWFAYAGMALALALVIWGIARGHRVSSRKAAD
ncbi:MAG: nitrilase-related carbon-nitrogen hydrolase [Spirochaetia bacterium]|jgi:apolipoprotein N-acyltransferase